MADYEAMHRLNRKVDKPTSDRYHRGAGEEGKLYTILDSYGKWKTLRVTKARVRMGSPAAKSPCMAQV